MLTQALFDLFFLAVEGLLNLGDAAIPSQLLAPVTQSAQIIGDLLSWGPLGMVGLLFVTYLAIDVVFDIMFFVRNTYKLIPAKAT